MIASFFLVVTENGSVRTVKNRPDLKYNEVAISVKLNLPQALFIKPQLNAVITVPDSAVSPSVIDAEMTNNIRDAIETATGLQIRLSVEPPAES